MVLRDIDWESHCQDNERTIEQKCVRVESPIHLCKPDPESRLVLPTCRRIWLWGRKPIGQKNFFNRQCIGA